MRKQLVVAVAIASVVTGLLVPAAAQAARASTHARVVAVAASSTWVVVKRQVSSGDLTPYLQQGDVLSATDAAGHEVRLRDFRGSGHDRVRLVGSTVAQATRTADLSVYQERVRYRDLDSGRTGSVTGRVGDELIAAAPAGWVVQRATGAAGATGPTYGLVEVRAGGVETALGSPFPEGEDYWVQASESGLVSYTRTVDETCATSRVRFMPWGDPGAWRTVYAGAPRSCIACAPATTGSVACRATKPDRGLVVLSLRGGAPRWLKATHPRLCQTVNFATSRNDLVAIETTDAGACTKGVLYRFGADTKVATSTRRFSAQGSIRTGLGRILVSKGQQRVVSGLAGVTRVPHAIAAA